MHQSHLKRLYLIAAAALFTALIFLVTAYLLHIPVPATSGYVHLGDAFVYLAASLLPTPFAVAAGGMGEALSDALTGSVVYAIPTLLIKAAMALCFTAKARTILCKRNIMAVFAAGLICIAGYYLTETFLLHSFWAPVAEIPMNLLQAVASGAIYLAIGFAFDKAKIKDRLNINQL